MDDRPNIAILGGGIVGLFVAIYLQQNGFNSILLEKEPFFGHHTSSRNSGVIHSPVFYKSGSLKEVMCQTGNILTYDWAKRLRVRHKRTGKLIISDMSKLQSLKTKLDSLSVNCVLISDTRSVESKLSFNEGLVVRNTGIIDVADYIKKLVFYASSIGVTLVDNCHVCEIQKNRLITTRGNMEFDCFINSCGLWSDEIAKECGLQEYSIKPVRGDYAIINESVCILPIYSMPEKENDVLGVHLTPTFDGKTLIGPNAFSIDKKDDYSHKTNLKIFVDSVRNIIYNIDKYSVSYAYSGNRPKLFVGDEKYDDFMMIQKDKWIHLLGIESPGLTAAPAIAIECVRMVKELICKKIS